MRVSAASVAIILLALLYGTAVSAQTDALAANLSLGSRGAPVIALQRMLNRDPDTRIAESGLGSPGYETSYFGPLTKAAVMRFQEKYASEVLVPAGLSYGNGYVGFYTRTKLNALSAQKTSTASAAAPAVPPSSAASPIYPSVAPLIIPTSVPVTLPSASPAPTTASQNPNLQNIDKFMAALDATAAEQGISAGELAVIKAQVMKEVATTTNLRSAFLKQVAYAPQAARDASPMGKMRAAIAQVFDAVFMPERARAALPIAPFGGALLFPVYCNISNTWLLTIEPLPPTFATLLTYVPFTQAFASYNIPLTNWLLGYYVPKAGVCWIGACPACTYVPSWGMITPVVGSSPLPLPVPIPI